MNIVCRKTKCKYNNNQACNSPKLLIDSELNCEQYEPVEKGSLQDVSRNMMEVAPEIAPFKHNKDIEISCQANCVFNKDGECKANGIFVNGQTPKANDKIVEIVENDEQGQSGSKPKKATKSVLRKKGKESNFGSSEEACNSSCGGMSSRNCDVACGKNYCVGGGMNNQISGKVSQRSCTNADACGGCGKTQSESEIVCNDECNSSCGGISSCNCDVACNQQAKKVGLFGFMKRGKSKIGQERLKSSTNQAVGDEKTYVSDFASANGLDVSDNKADCDSKVTTNRKLEKNCVCDKNQFKDDDLIDDDFCHCSKQNESGQAKCFTFACK